jgi:hypothetical protein
MTRAQEIRYNMFQKMKLFFQNNTVTLSTLVPFATEITTFLAKLVQLDKIIVKQTKETSGVTEAKTLSKTNMCSIVATNAAIATAWARSANMLPELAILDQTQLELESLPDAESIGACSNIYNVLNTNIAALAPYNILPVTVTAIGAAITDFTNKQESPQEAIDQREQATDDITPQENSIEETLTITDGLIHNWDTTNPALVAQYFLDRKRDNTGGHHTGFEGTVTLSGTPVAGVQVIDKATSTLLASSDLNGFYQKQIIKPGLREVIYRLTGNPDIITVLNLQRGKILHKDITF